MKSKLTLILLSSLILTVGYPTSVTAVTDAELEALEKQLEQLESEEKQKAEAAAKRKGELEKQRLEEIKRIAEEETKRLNAIPNISGTWTGISDGGTKTSSKYIINQDGSILHGRFLMNY